MKTPISTSTLKRVFLSAVAASSLFTASHAFGQVFGPGPSDPALFTSVFNIPNDLDLDDTQSFGGVIGETTQINLSDGGDIGGTIEINSGAELNVDGGSVNRVRLGSGSEFNASGGIFARGFGVPTDSVVNISGGVFRDDINTFNSDSSGGSVDVSGGIFTSISFSQNANASISGGNFLSPRSLVDERAFSALSTSDVELVGGDFKVNGVEFNGSDFTLDDGDVFTATLQDGSAFIATSQRGDILESVSLTTVALPMVDKTPIVITLPRVNSITSVRGGQTLAIREGGELGQINSVDATLDLDGGTFDGGTAIGSTVNIINGSMPRNFSVFFSQVNVSGGRMFRLNTFSTEVDMSDGSVFDLNAGTDSIVNVSGGVIGDTDALSGSVFNISGGEIGGGVFGEGFDALDGSVINITGGNFVRSFEAFSGSEVNISGGNLQDFAAREGSTVDISGGTFDLAALSESDVSIRGGNFVRAFFSFAANVQLIGGEFQLNGNDVDGATVSINSGDLFTGTLEDGSTFIFPRLLGSDLNLTHVNLPTFDETSVVDTDLSDSLSGLRSGQTLTLVNGGVLSDDFRAIGGTLNIEGGILGDFAGSAGTTINISGGRIGNGFDAYDGSTVNISRGSVGTDFNANSGSEINISGGFVSTDFNANAGSTVNVREGLVGFQFDANEGSTVNISGGVVGDQMDACRGSIVNITGGFVGSEFDAFNNSQVFISGGGVGRGFTARSNSFVLISGGTVGRNFVTFEDSDVEISGGEFQLNGVSFDGQTISLDDGDVFTGTLADGSAFIFDRESDDRLDNVTLSRTTVPEADTTPIIITSATLDVPATLRPGQTLTLQSGFIDGDFEAVGGVINIDGRGFSEDTGFFNTTVNLNDGSLGFEAIAYSGSELNLFDGTVNNLLANSGSQINVLGNVRFRNQFFADAGSVVDVFASEFFVNDVEVEFTDGGTPFLLESRDVLLSGVFADGSTFEYDLRDDFSVSEGATLRLNLVAEPTLLGDINLDGVVNFLDIPQFVSLLTTRTFQTEADIDQSGEVNFLDISPFVELLIGSQNDE